MLLTLDPDVDSGIQKTRLCLILSPPQMHDRLRTELAALMTTAAFPAGFVWQSAFKVRMAWSLPAARDDSAQRRGFVDIFG